MGKLGYACKEPGCPAMVTNARDRYCEAHKKLPENKGWQSRTSERLSLYDKKRWQRVRLKVIRANPICEVCKTNAATDVHHIKPAREFPELAFVLDNLQAICKYCHVRETNRETSERRRKMKGIG